jgi:hypothetical protein
MLLMAVVAAVGTFVEARWGLNHAQKLVYRSPWMAGVMIIFIINLTAVIIDRWPWQRKHAAFILAHVGIIMIVLGQWLTNNKGLDGTLRIPIGGQAQQVTVQDTEIQIWSSFDGESYTRLYRDDVDFISHPPSEKDPRKYKLEDFTLQFLEYQPFVIPKREIVPSEEPRDGRGLRFQLKNPSIRQAQMIEWLYQRNPTTTDHLEMGPLIVSLGPIKKIDPERNQLNFQFEGTGGDGAPLGSSQEGRVLVAAYDKGQSLPAQTWKAREGDTLNLKWMGFELKILRSLPQAREKYDLSFRSTPTDLTTAAVRIRYRDQDHWVLQNDTLKIFSETAVYILSFGQKRIELNFPVQLEKFEMENYQGTRKAKAYKSVVTIPADEKNLGVTSHLISMNEPLKYRGLTFYQASFQNDPTGRPVASILSVNYDPGRFLKYLGSLIMSLGIILLFYFKRSSLWTTPKK